MRSLSLAFALVVALLALTHVAAQMQNQWVKQPSMPFGRSDFTIATVNGNAYIMGGCATDQELDGPCLEVTNRFSAYNFASNTFEVLASAPNNRTRYNVAVVDGSIYYIGGRALVDSDMIVPVDIYNIAARTWSSVTPATNLHLVSDGGAWANGRNIYVTGGYIVDYSETRASTVSVSVDALAAGFTSSSVADLPVAAGDIALVGPYEGKVYVFGGFSTDFCEPLQTLTMLDIASNKWSAQARMRSGRADMGATMIGSKIYAIGGQTSTSSCRAQMAARNATKSVPVDDVEVYDIASGAAAQWAVVSDLAEERMRFSSAADVTNQRLLNFGGQGKQTGTSQENIDSPSNTDGYYPVLADVYSLDLNAATAASSSSTGPAHHVVGAAAAVSSSLAAVVAVLAAAVVAIRA